jgi:hypothetical protein
MSRPTSSETGIVIATDIGSKVSRMRPMVGRPTPLASSSSATSMIVGI